MLGALTLLFACQLAGEAVVAGLGLPVPGPVAGMLLLLIGLLLRGGIPPDLAMVGDGFLSNLSLLFVPAGVGVMLHAGVLGRDGAALTVALVVSTIASIAATGLVMARLSRRAASTDASDDKAGSP